MWSQELKQVPDQDSFKESALTLEKGMISPAIQAAKAAYVIRVIDRKDPDPTLYEQEKTEFRRGLLNRKREQVYSDWVRQVRARAKVKIEQANL
jgi:parvulin-like peptidyl-prolyl isomerase